MKRRSLEISSAHSTNNHSQVHTPSSSVPSTPIVPAGRPPSPAKKALHDSSGFLTALAAQERRVLELKEELQRAEADLGKLKKQWAVHETTKKRNEMRQVEPLQPFSAPSPGREAFEDNQASRVTREQERQKLRPLTTRQPRRTVFSGSRHTKTLSLVSPKSSVPSAGDQGHALGTATPTKALRGTTEGPSRSNTVPELSTASARMSNAPNPPRSPQPVSGPPEDPLLETGKQLVGDFKEGFWTFFEDLRQATVGEEIENSNANVVRRPTVTSKPDVAANDSTPRPSNAASKHSSGHGSSLHGKPQAFKDPLSGSRNNPKSTASNSEHATTKSPKTKQRRNLTIETTTTETDGWDSWDSPPQTKSPQCSSTSNSNSDPLASPMTDHSSPRTSLR